MEYFFLAILLIILLGIFSLFRPAPTKVIDKDLYAVRSAFVNFYVIKTGDRIILFDTGTSSSAAKRGLQKLNLLPENVTDIFLTHTDYDHAGGIFLFKNAKVYISGEEEQMINGKTRRRFLIHNRKLSGYHMVKNGDILTVGGVKIEVHLCEGHTPGSITFDINENIYVCGDLCRLSRKGEITPFLRLMDMNHRTSINSLKSEASTIEKSKYILTGHTGYINKSI